MKWTYDVSERGKNHTNVIDEIYYKNNSDKTKERLRIVKRTKNDKLCYVFYTKMQISNRLNIYGEYEWEIINNEERYMTYDESRKIIYEDRLKKLNRLLNEMDI